MRVRPFFWLILAFACASVLIFSATISVYKAVPLQARIEQLATSNASTTMVRVKLTDSEGVPVDQASITPHAYMPDMAMPAPNTRVQPLGQGLYLARIDFTMPGNWKIDIIAHANGFDTMKQSLSVEVV